MHIIPKHTEAIDSKIVDLSDLSAEEHRFPGDDLIDSGWAGKQ